VVVVRRSGPSSYYEPGLKCSTRDNLSLSLYFSVFQLLYYPFNFIFSLQLFDLFQTSFRIHIHTLLHSVHADAYIIYLVLRIYIHAYTTCLHTYA
jgi:hypothetical protein